MLLEHSWREVGHHSISHRDSVEIEEMRGYPFVVRAHIVDDRPSQSNRDVEGAVTLCLQDLFPHDGDGRSGTMPKFEDAVFQNDLRSLFLEIQRG